MKLFGVIIAIVVLFIIGFIYLFTTQYEFCQKFISLFSVKMETVMKSFQNPENPFYNLSTYTRNLMSWAINEDLKGSDSPKISVSRAVIDVLNDSKSE